MNRKGSLGSASNRETFEGDSAEGRSLREVEVGFCYPQKDSEQSRSEKLVSGQGWEAMPSFHSQRQSPQWGYFENYCGLSPINSELMRSSPCTGGEGPSGGGRGACVDSEHGTYRILLPSWVPRKAMGTAVCSKPLISQASWFTDD